MRKKIKDKVDKVKQSLFDIKDNADFSIELGNILKIYDSDIDNMQNLASMCYSKKVLALCMMLEDCGQADTILEFFDEYPNYIDETIGALEEIGAPKSAEIIRKAKKILPTNGLSFFDVADDVMWKSMKELDSEFSRYPDGPTDILYRKYAEKHKEDFI